VHRSSIRPVTSVTEARTPKARASSVAKDVRAIRSSLAVIVRALTRLAPALDAATRGSANPGRRGRKLSLSPARRASLKLQGHYMGYLRALKSGQKARVKRLRATKGVRAAISLARRLAHVSS
jgi:hypothetical protein